MILPLHTVSMTPSGTLRGFKTQVLISLKTHITVYLNHVNPPSMFNIEDDISLHKISVTENILM